MERSGPIPAPISIEDLTTLPYEVFFEIALNLSYETIISLCRSFRRLRRLCADSYFWNQKIQAEFNFDPDLELEPDQLRLPGRQRYLYLLSKIKETCVPGSEQVVSFDECLFNTGKNRSPFLDYFLNRSRDYSPAVAGATAGNYNSLVYRIMDRARTRADPVDLQEAFSLSALNGNLELFRYFVNNGANDLESAYSDAAAGNNVNIMEEIRLLRPGLTSNPNLNQETLEIASKYGSTNAIKWLLKRFGNNRRLFLNLSSFWSSYYGHPETVLILIKEGANPVYPSIGSVHSDKSLKVLSEHRKLDMVGILTGALIYNDPKLLGKILQTEIRYRLTKSVCYVLDYLSDIRGSTIEPETLRAGLENFIQLVRDQQIPFNRNAVLNLVNDLEVDGFLNFEIIETIRQII